MSFTSVHLNLTLHCVASFASWCEVRALFEAAGSSKMDFCRQQSAVVSEFGDWDDPESYETLNIGSKK